MEPKDHDLLIEIKTKVDRVIADVRDINTNIVSKVDSLEKDKVDRTEFEKVTGNNSNRISWLERIAYGGIAILAAVEFYYRIIK